MTVATGADNSSPNLSCAVPAGGAVPARSQLAWIRAVESHPDCGMLRADAHRNVTQLVWVLARWADWQTMTSRPGWDTLMSTTGLSRATVAAWLRWLRERGLLVVVEHGTTPRFTPRAERRDDDRNTAAVYLLTATSQVPADRAPGFVDGTRTPTWVLPARCPEVERCRRYTRAREPGGREAPTLRVVATDDPTGAAVLAPWPRWAPAVTNVDRLALCLRLSGELPVVAAVGRARRVRHLLRPWLQAGWTVRGLVYAIDHTPDGEPHRFAWRSMAEIRNPAGWLLHRLRLWRDPAGELLPDPTAPVSGPPARPRDADPAPSRSAARSAAVTSTPTAGAPAARSRTVGEQDRPEPPLLLARSRADAYGAQWRALQRARAERAVRTGEWPRRPDGRTARQPHDRLSDGRSPASARQGTPPPA